MSLVLLLGGARSGKSALAVELAQRAGEPVVVVATAQARDEEMAERIREHSAARPADWAVVEEPIELCAALQAIEDGATILVDCLSLWVANLLERGERDSEVETRARDAAGFARNRDGVTIAVSNEVGLGIVPISALGRRYRDVLGRVNAAWAAAAEEAAFVVAGRALRLESAEALL
jgi:adenosylcobinamide kinase / adenosylcobinamide-phosphate guanylyltransferase